MAMLQRIKRLLRRETHEERVERLYRTKDYLDAYSEDTDIRVEQDPRTAVGGKWKVIGRLQFDFMVSVGLEPHHTMLDVGCGTLRGGRHFIDYLDPSRYTGIDISSKAIEFGHTLIEDEGLGEKRPKLLLNEDKRLDFSEFDDESFDFILAQSVFTHLGPELIEECFDHLGAVMTPESRFCFTFNEDAMVRQSNRRGFVYPFSFFEDLAARHDFEVVDRSDDYDHPRGQRMVVLTKRR